MMKLWTNGTETYVARDAEHASALYESDTGETHRPCDICPWRERVSSLDTPMSICLDDGRGDFTLTVAEWIATLPDGGMLCSTEY